MKLWGQVQGGMELEALSHHAMAQNGTFPTRGSLTLISLIRLELIAIYYQQKFMSKLMKNTAKQQNPSEVPDWEALKSQANTIPHCALTLNLHLLKISSTAWHCYDWCVNLLYGCLVRMEP